MEIKTMSGHLTQTNKVHIKAMMERNLTSAKVNRITYQIEKINKPNTANTTHIGR